MSDEKDELIQKLYQQRNMAYMTLDRILAVLTYSGICPDCGASRKDCTTEEECKARQAQVDEWLGDLNGMLDSQNAKDDYYEKNEVIG